MPCGFGIMVGRVRDGVSEGDTTQREDLGAGQCHGFNEFGFRENVCFSVCHFVFHCGNSLSAVYKKSSLLKLKLMDGKCQPIF